MHIKPYLSYSQYTCFNNGTYKRVYIDQIKFQSKYLDFGGKIAEAFEKEKKAEKLDEIDKVILKLKKPQMSEHPILVDFHGIPLYGRLDGLDLNLEEKTAKITEYKTGKVPWTKARVEAHEQLDFYAIMVNKKFEIPYENIDIELIWLETFEDTDGSLHLTGKIKTFKTKKTIQHSIRIYPKMKKAWVGIEKLINEVIN